MLTKALILSITVHLAFSRPSIRECRVAELGQDYQGKVNTTYTDIQCQRWDAQSPHEHNLGDAAYFPDSSLSDAANYCRNPDDDSVGLWCYTTDPDIRYLACDVPLCSEHPECRRTDEGTEYLGFLSTSASGSECLPWSETDYPDQDENYCRNPDGRVSGPWCYVSQDVQESCDVPFCKPSASCKRTPAGTEYSGTVSWTVNGRTCQRWATQYPHNHTLADEDFPDGSVSAAENFCRNPDDETGPWCYTTDPNTRWELCNLPSCQECKVSLEERNYFGSTSQTRNGFTCQRWDAQSPHSHNFTDPQRFPDASVEAAENYCRNPDGKLEGPWCYTEDVFVEWDYCDVPTCSSTSADEPLVPLANHVLHIGIDGLRPDCIELAPGGAPNILDRLGRGGTYTLTNARAVLETVSAPGWSSQLCGMPIERTGVNGNGWVPMWMGSSEDITPVTGRDSAMPCVFQTLKNQDATIKTSSMFDWSWIRWMSSKGYPGYIDMEIDCRDDYETCDQEIANRTVDYLIKMYNTTEKSYTFVYFGNVDSLGHSHGWCLDEYNDGVDVVDAQVGQLLDAVAAAGKEHDTVVMMSADHGGLGTGHGRQIDDDLLVPMFIKGPGIKVNHLLTTAVDLTDMAPTAMRVLGLKPSPWWSGSIMYDAFQEDIED